MEKSSVCAVLVTFNRKNLLLEVLNDLCQQSHPVSGIVIVDNCSTDGTADLLVEEGVIPHYSTGTLVKHVWNNIKIYYYLSKTNTGGSGGFKRAFYIASKLNYDFIWAMDDDVGLEKDCLKYLLDSIDESAKVCIPCRTDQNWTDYPVINYNLSNPFLVNLKQYKTIVDSRTIDKDYIYVEDMPLEGPLVSMDIIKKVGIPNSDYFIMFDDTDFAHRIAAVTNIKYVVKAKIHRKLATSNPAVEEWNWKEYYLLRNSFYFDRKYGCNILVKYFRPLFSSIAKIISAIMRRKPYRVKVVLRAYKDALCNKMGKTVEPGTDVTKW